MAPEDLHPLPTTTGTTPLGELRRDMWSRRLLLTLIFGIVVVGAANLLGIRMATAIAAGGGFELVVEYAEVSRPGLPTPWSVEVRRPGGFAGSVTVGISRDYLALFDLNFVHPEPSASTSQNDLVVWEFDPPRGELLRISIDGRLEPRSHLTDPAVVSVLVEGRPVATASYETRVVP